MLADEAQATVKGFIERTGAFLTCGTRAGTRTDTSASDELHGGATDEIPRFSRKQNCRGAQHAQIQGRRRRHGHPQVPQSPVHLAPLHSGTTVGDEDLVYHGEVKGRDPHRNKGLVFTAAMFPLAHEAGHCIPTQGLSIAAYTSEQASVGGSDNPTSYLGHGADRQFQLVDLDLADLDVNAALQSDTGNPILGVLGEWAADDIFPIIHSVDDQATVRHGH